VVAVFRRLGGARVATGHLYMVLGLLSFGVLGVLHKVADVKRSRPSAITALLYSWSLVLIVGFVLLKKPAGLAAPSSVMTVALPFGISAAIAILAFQAGVKHGNIATSWLAINLSAGIPTVASILVYGEPVSVWKAIALVLIPVSMTLLWKDKKDEERRSRHEPIPTEVMTVQGGGPA
jgi:EamA domain-containing membrane protein RarD